MTDATHSWRPVPLVGLDGEPVEPPRIGRVLYRDRVHLLSGEPESLKSWAGFVLCVEEMNAERAVMFVDFESSARDAYERLCCLGVSDVEIDARFLYFQPSEPLGEDSRSDVECMVREKRPSLVVIDATIGALTLHGLDPNSGVDVERFHRIVVAPFRVGGAAVAVIDHLTKNPEGRGKFAIGSERKVGAVDVHLGFKVVTPFGRGRVGRARVAVRKDRPGFLPRPNCAELELVSDPTTGAIKWTWLSGEAQLEDGVFRPTALMERVSRFLEAQPEPIGRSHVESDVKGNTNHLRAAIDALVRDGFATEAAGPNRARLLRSARPYRENESAHGPLMAEAPESAHGPLTENSSVQASPLKSAHGPLTSPLLSPLTHGPSSKGPMSGQGETDPPGIGENGHVGWLMDAYDRGEITLEEAARNFDQHQLLTGERAGAHTCPFQRLPYSAFPARGRA
jgi:hypothetical protein